MTFTLGNRCNKFAQCSGVSGVRKSGGDFSSLIMAMVVMKRKYKIYAISLVDLFCHFNKDLRIHFCIVLCICFYVYSFAILRPLKLT